MRTQPAAGPTQITAQVEARPCARARSAAVAPLPCQLPLGNGPGLPAIRMLAFPGLVRPGVDAARAAAARPKSGILPMGRTPPASAPSQSIEGQLRNLSLGPLARVHQWAGCFLLYGALASAGDEPPARGVGPAKAYDALAFRFAKAPAMSALRAFRACRAATQSTVQLFWQIRSGGRARVNQPVATSHAMKR